MNTSHNSQSQKVLAQYNRIGGIFATPITIMFLFIAMGVDFLFQYPTTELLFTQGQFLSIFNALAFAFSIDALPLVMSSCTLQLCEPGQKSRKYIFLLVASILAFLIIFGLSVTLKLALIDFLFAGATELADVPVSTSTEAIVASSTSTSDTPTLARLSMVLIQCSVQLGTSLFLFALGMQRSISEQRKAFETALYLDLFEKNGLINAQIHELDDALATNRSAIESEKLAYHIAYVDGEAALQKEQARLALAEKQKSPTASSKLLERTA